MSESTNSKIILLGICGGVAAYKALELASALRQRGHSVHVAMSQSAQEFVTPLSFSSITGNPVLTDQFPGNEQGSPESNYPHLYPATQADAFILVPATANKMGQLAQGVGVDVVSTSALSLPASCARLFCPSMNVEMWEQESVQQNVAALEGLGWQRIGPESGHLACGMTGAGRLAAPADIVAACEQRLEQAHSLDGKTVMILSGPSHEHFDPVRYIGNPSSGRMGHALALAAAHRGARVEFITGPVDARNLPSAPGITLHRVTSAADMLAAAQAVQASTQLWIFAAAVADYTPAETLDHKPAKQQGDITVTLKSTPDIAATLAEVKQPGQVSIGFALQTGDGESEARGKLQRKRFDGIVLNHLNALGGDTGTYRWISEGKDAADWGALKKSACAHRILNEAATLLPS